ncbi:large ribosomal subunit protein eL8-like isoform X2 [Amphiura filiformis]|uniref:large ribosomal subunit protein eL8-like isoform X2 n=1 Tax=Amphiura filiformis TaxID=82378 RepID=UPI003B221631
MLIEVPCPKTKLERRQVCEATLKSASRGCPNQEAPIVMSGINTVANRKKAQLIVNAHGIEPMSRSWFAALPRVGRYAFHTAL